MSEITRKDCLFYMDFQPTHFRALPDNRLADALEVAVKAMTEAGVVIHEHGGGVYGAISAITILEKTLAEIQAIAERKE